MATTATNKQPLLVDRVFHNVVKGNTLTSGSGTSLNIVGTNESSVLVDCTNNDGGVIEDLYVIARTSTTTIYTAVFYFSSSVDYLRPSEALYVGQLVSSDTEGTLTASSELPKILAPLPSVGNSSQLRALYVPKGKALWCSLKLDGPTNSDDTPIIGAQGGFY